MYADYEYYQKEFFGGLLSEELFAKYERKARNNIDYLTRNKAKDYLIGSVGDKVKQAVCTAAELYFNQDQSIKFNKELATRLNGLKSENVEGHSQSWQSPVSEKDIILEFETTINRQARKILTPTGLLYGGI